MRKLILILIILANFVFAFNVFAAENMNDLQELIDSSVCLKELPKKSAVRFILLDQDGYVDNVFFISDGNISKYDNQRFDFDVVSSIDQIKIIENSDSVDIGLKRVVDSKGLTVYYQDVFKILKYWKVKACINKIQEKENKRDWFNFWK